MVNVKPEVRSALAPLGVPVFMHHPDRFDALPCVSYYELSNAPAASADDREYASRVDIECDVWAATWENASELAGLVTVAMEAAGFSRQMSRDIWDGSRAKHKTMRFGIIR